MEISIPEHPMRFPPDSDFLESLSDTEDKWQLFITLENDDFPTCWTE